MGSFFVTLYLSPTLSSLLGMWYKYGDGEPVSEKGNTQQWTEY